MRLFLVLSLVGLASLAAGFYFREFNLGSAELRFIADFGFGSISLFGSIATIVVGVQLVYGDIENKTVLPVLAKPVSRGEFVIGKLAGAWATACCFVFILTVSLLLALWIRESQIALSADEGAITSERVSYAGVLLFAAAQCIRFLILSAATVFLSSYASSSLFAVFASMGVWILGQLRGSLPNLVESGQDTVFSVSGVLSLLVPDLSQFDLGAALFDGSAFGAASLWGLLAYALAYTFVYSVLAVLVLKNREF
nr:ABC transporter permease subunit [Pelagicoccus albus]